MLASTKLLFNLNNTVTAIAGSVFKAGWRDCPKEWYQPSLDDDIKALRELRHIANTALSEAQSQQHIRSFLEASVTIYTNSAPLQSLLSTTFTDSSCPTTQNKSTLSDFLLVSQATLLNSDKEHGVSTTTDSILNWSKDQDCSVCVSVNVSPLHKCPRCWKHTVQEKEHMCERCQSVLQ